MLRKTAEDLSFKILMIFAGLLVFRSFILQTEFEMANGNIDNFIDYLSPIGLLVIIGLVIVHNFIFYKN